MHRDPFDAVDGLELRKDRRLLMVEGFERSEPVPARRTGIFERGDSLELLCDVWVSEDHRDRLRKQLAARSDLRVGGWDVMAQTDWRYAWTEDEGDFSLWNRTRRVAGTSGNTLVLDDRPPIGFDAISSVEPYVDDSWVERGVRLILGDQSTETLVEYREADAASPFLLYDGLDLLADSYWIVELGEALAESVGAELRDRTAEA